MSKLFRVRAMDQKLTNLVEAVQEVNPRIDRATIVAFAAGYAEATPSSEIENLKFGDIRDAFLNVINTTSLVLDLQTR